MIGVWKLESEGGLPAMKTFTSYSLSFNSDSTFECHAKIPMKQFSSLCIKSGVCDNVDMDVPNGVVRLRASGSWSIKESLLSYKIGTASGTTRVSFEEGKLRFAQDPILSADGKTGLASEYSH